MHVELLQILVAGGLTRNSYNAEASLIIVRLVVLVLLSQDTQCSFSIDESLKEGLILLAILMVEKLVVLWVGKARLVGSGHVAGGNFSEKLRFKLYINNLLAAEQRPTTSHYHHQFDQINRLIPILILL